MSNNKKKGYGLLLLAAVVVAHELLTATNMTALSIGIYISVPPLIYFGIKLIKTN